MVNEKIYFCEQHISALEKKLDKIFTIKVPSEIEDEFFKGNINALKELEKFKYMEGIYSIVERNGVHQGEVYEKYKGYLDLVRKRVEVLQKEVDKIEKENAAEIKNIKVLLDAFKIALNKAQNEASV